MDESDHEGEHHHEDFIEAEREHRLAKLKELADRGIAPYPVKFDRDHTIGEIREKYPSLEPGADTGETVRRGRAASCSCAATASSCSPTCTTRRARSSSSSATRTWATRASRTSPSGTAATGWAWPAT